MCIRDSRRPVRAHDRAFDRIPGGVPQASFRGRFQDRARACLLYTSDAADDLLCVDTGGRRIIKKKTTQCTHTLV
mgnify:CR=1 FL=1